MPSSFQDIVTLILACAATLGLLSILLMSLLFSARKAKKFHAQELIQMKAEFETEMRLVEREIRQRSLDTISSYLHEGVGQQLTVIKLQLHQETPDSSALPLLKSVMVQVRELSHYLHAEHAAHFNLFQQIAQEADQLSTVPDLQVSCELEPGDCLLEKDQQLILFRNFQEIIQNTLKHAEARHIRIRCTRQPFSLSVEDDGKGFSPAPEEQGGQGLGLGNIRRRSRLTGLLCTLDSSPGTGTRYLFTLS